MNGAMSRILRPPDNVGSPGGWKNCAGAAAVLGLIIGVICGLFFKPDPKSNDINIRLLEQHLNNIDSYEATELRSRGILPHGQRK